MKRQKDVDERKKLIKKIHNQMKKAKKKYKGVGGISMVVCPVCSSSMTIVVNSNNNQARAKCSTQYCTNIMY